MLRGSNGIAYTLYNGKAFLPLNKGSFEKASDPSFSICCESKQTLYKKDCVVGAQAISWKEKKETRFLTTDVAYRSDNGKCGERGVITVIAAIIRLCDGQPEFILSRYNPDVTGNWEYEFVTGRDCHRRLYDEFSRKGGIEYNYNVERDLADSLHYEVHNVLRTIDDIADRNPTLAVTERNNLLSAYHQGNDQFGLLSYLPEDERNFQNFRVFLSETSEMKAEVLRVTNEAKKTRKSGKKPADGLDVLVCGPRQGVMWKNQDSSYLFGDKCWEISERYSFQDREAAKQIQWSLTFPKPQVIQIPDDLEVPDAFIATSSETI